MESITIRPIEPGDRELLVEGMKRLTPESRYRRFLSPTTELSAAQLRYLTEVDHHDHEALIATDRATGVGVGVARFVRSEDDPAVAELAVAVTDDWQGRGVGTALLRSLTDRAREEGVERFSATVLEQNRPILELLERLGPVELHAREAGAVELEVELPRDGGVAQGLVEALRAAARGELRPRMPRRLPGRP